MPPHPPVVPTPTGPRLAGRLPAANGLAQVRPPPRGRAWVVELLRSLRRWPNALRWSARASGEFGRASRRRVWIPDPDGVPAPPAAGLAWLHHAGNEFPPNRGPLGIPWEPVASGWQRRVQPVEIHRLEGWLLRPGTRWEQSPESVGPILEIPAEIQGRPRALVERPQRTLGPGVHPDPKRPLPGRPIWSRSTVH